MRRQARGAAVAPDSHAFLKFIHKSVGRSPQWTAPATKPGQEHKQLDTLIGKWNSEGEAQAVPMGRRGNAFGGNLRVASWRVLHEPPMGHTTGSRRVQGNGNHWVRRSKQVYTSRFFDNFGNSGSSTARLQGNTWTWTGDSEIGAKPVRERCTVTVTSPDSYTNKCEYSTDGAEWLTTFVLRSTRAK
jgi:hypothetical protein